MVELVYEKISISVLCFYLQTSHLPGSFNPLHAMDKTGGNGKPSGQKVENIFMPLESCLCHNSLIISE